MTDKFSEFKKDIENYWHCEVRDAESGSDLLTVLQNPLHPISEDDFARFLANAILNKTISTQDYESLTAIEFEDVDEVVEDLRDLWEMTFGNLEIK